MTVVSAHALAVKAKLFRGLADPSRLAIIESLRSGEKTVSELVMLTGLSQPNTSGHLACLKECGLVTSRQAARFVYYAIADERLEDVLRQAGAILATIAESMYACTRYQEEQPPRQQS
ncbi:MAG: metalloregulator ArsR/SmtB family transcription factor [Chloroflexi bacterium OHK40]